MRVALDVGPLAPNPAGVGLYVRSLAAAMESLLGADALTLFGRRPDAEGLPTAVASSARSAGVPYPIWNQILGSRAARRTGADVAHFTDGLVPIGRPAPTVVTVHDLSLVRRIRSHRAGRYPRIPLILAAPRLATRVIVPSRFTADEVIRLTGTAASRIDVVPLAPGVASHPVSDHDLLPALVRLGLVRDRYVLIPGTIEPRKNHLLLLRAFERLVDHGRIADDLSLVVAGAPGWRSEAIVRAIDDSRLGHRVRRVGYVADAEMGVLMTGAAVVAYLSDYEGFGLPVAEAMACGAAVLISDRPALVEVAGPAAMATRAVDEREVADSLETILRDDRGRGDLRRLGLERSTSLTWGRTAEGTVAAYRRAVGG